MEKRYEEMFQRLMKAYYNNQFEEALDSIMGQFTDREEAKEVLAILCGVDFVQEKEESEYTQELLHAITKQKVRDKIVQKIGPCYQDCFTENGRSRCQTVCPLEAIKRVGDGQDKWIDPSICMECGRCIEVCEKGLYIDTKEFFPMATLLKGEHKVVAMVAPAIAGQFGSEVTLDQLREAFIKVGFSDMVEVAMAADVLSIKEALEFDAHVQSQDDYMLTSCCCPMWIGMLRKKYNELMPDVSPSVSPMIALAKMLKKYNPEVKVVFVGPCVAKKAEAKEPDLIGEVDFVLTFSEIKMVFDTLEVDPIKLQGAPTMDYAATGGVLYARAGGVSQAVYSLVEHLSPEKKKIFTSLHVDGVPACKAMLEDLLQGKVHATFIEGMGCVGGCVGGPKRLVSMEEGRWKVNQMAEESAIKVPIHSDVLKNLLGSIGYEKFGDLLKEHSMFERKF